MSSRTITRSAALALIIGFMLTGSRPVTAADPIKIGAALSLTGRFSDSAKYVQEGYQLWLAEVNARGGINGRPVELVTYDDESNPDTAAVLTERLISRDGVVAILGPYSSPITDAAATVVERAGVPMIGTIASDNSIWERRKLRWTVQAFPSSTYDHEGFLKVVASKGKAIKRLAIVYEESPFSVTAKNWAMDELKKMRIPADAFGYTPGSQDFSSIVERIVASKADAVSMGGYYQPSVALTRKMIERGYSPVAYHFIQAADGVTKTALGDNANGIFGRSAWEATFTDPASKAFAGAYRAKYNRAPSYHSAAAFAAGQVLEAALRAKGSDKNGIREFIETSSMTTVLGSYKLNAKLQQEGYRYTLTQWINGESKIVREPSAALWPKPAWK
ncbi:MAG: amino acid ABC transporter substrate-binding protein [Candidatus Elarobacter sp.]